MNKLEHPLVRLTRLWLAVYTCGLSTDAKLGRRAEVESDIWEQLSDPQSSAMSPAHVAARCVLGMPADITWRLQHATSTREKGGRSIVNPSINRWTYVFAGVGLAAIAAALTIVVVDNLQYHRGEEYVVPSNFLVTSSFALLALSLAGVAGGFFVMQRSPDLGAALAIAGGLTGGLLFYWLILPPLLGIAIAVYASSRARRMRGRFRD